MALRVQNNIAAMNAYRNLSVTDSQMSKSLEKLSSGFRINRAGDDAAGLVISENLRSQASGLKQAARNAMDGVSVVQTAEGALTEVTSMLQRMRDLTIQSKNDTNSTESRNALQAELNELSGAIADIASRTEFNGTKLLNGTAGVSGVLSFQVGAKNGDTLAVTTRDVTANTLNVESTDLVVGGSGTVATRDTALTNIDAAIATVTTFRGALGAAQNRLEYTINNLSVTEENLTASESRIRDTDMAMEMTSFSKNQILSQAGTAMLAQANQSSQGVLSLFR